jgi:hypothetical protein
VLIIDMVLCVIRALLVVVSIVSIAAIPRESSIFIVVVFEIGMGVGIVIFGLSGDLLLLLKQRWAVGLAWLTVLCTFGAVIVGFWALWVLAEAMAGNDQARQVGYWVGGSIMLLVRLALLATYVAAVIVYAKWANQLPFQNEISTNE